MTQEVYRRKWLRWGVLFLILTLLLLFIEIIPSIKRIMEVKNEISIVNAKLEQIDGAEFQSGQLQRALANRNEQYRLIFSDEHLPSNTQTLSLIQELVSISGIKLGTLTPGNRVHHDKFSEWNFVLTATGSFHGHASFINELERSTLLVRFNHIQLVADGLIPKVVEAKYDFRIYSPNQSEGRP